MTLAQRIDSITHGKPTPGYAYWVPWFATEAEAKAATPHTPAWTLAVFQYEVGRPVEDGDFELPGTYNPFSADEKAFYDAHKLDASPLVTPKRVGIAAAVLALLGLAFYYRDGP